MKVDSRNYADWVRKLRIILIAAQKAYVLNAPLGVLNLERRLWMLRTSDIHVQCVMLNGLELRHLRRFRNVAEHMRCFEGWNWDFRLVPTSRGIRPPTSFLACKLREKSSIVELVLRLSEYNNHLNRVGVNLPDEIVMVLHSHCHQATRAS